MIEGRADFSHFNRMHFRAATVISTVVVFLRASSMCFFGIRHFGYGAEGRFRGGTRRQL